MRNSNNSMSLSEIMFIVLLSAVFGIIWCGYTFIYNILDPFLKPFGLEGLLTGVWLMGGIFFPYIIRKPGSSILGESVAAIVEALISQWGVGAIVYGVIQGIPSEIFFLIIRYRKWNWWSLSIASLLSGVCGSLLSIYWYKYYLFGMKYCVLYTIFSAFSSLFFAGVCSKFLADSMLKARVLNNFAIAQDKLTSL
jgi:energy-coupling factor transport system permease protein